MSASPQILRSYQERAVRQVREQWAAGKRAVCLVCPTGGGKTTIGTAAAMPFGAVVWVAHRKELIAQAVARLRAAGLHVGAICPGMPEDPTAPNQVCTIQSLLARGIRPPAELVVLDECHHYATASESWHSFLSAYPTALILGLTATPERRDGSCLGDIFDSLVVAASYSELLEAGHLAPCVVYAPPPDKARSGWAMDPVEAYTKFAPGSLCFAFFDRVKRANDWERAFSLAGVPARTIDGKTPDRDRDAIMASFSSGQTRVLCNVATMTEGVDVPPAATCLLTRNPQHASTYLQMVGRVLRPHPSKPHALLLDIADATSKHGYPTEDREYSLTGKAIVRASKSTVRRCLQCMAMYPSSLAACPLCGTMPPRPKPPEVRIYNAGLARVYAGADTPNEYKLQEYRRLRALAKSKGYSLQFVLTSYKKLFGLAPSFKGVPLPDRKREFLLLRATATARGYKPGYVYQRYLSLFGTSPPREWSVLPIDAAAIAAARKQAATEPALPADGAPDATP